MGDGDGGGAVEPEISGLFLALQGTHCVVAIRRRISFCGRSVEAARGDAVYLR